MLFEMATGNLVFRLQVEDKKDGTDAIIALLNELANKMQTMLVEYGYVRPFYSYQSLIQLTFVLDEEFTFKNCSANMQSILGYNPENMIGIRKMDAVIAPVAKEYWSIVTREINQHTDFHSTVNLIFLTQENLLLPKFCTISRLQFSNEIIITSLTTTLEDFLYDLPRSKSTSKPKISQIETLQKIHDYIMDNLDQPLLTLRELSRMFNINESDLKNGFRAFFHTSIHKFYNEQRLRRAHLMILQTDIPLKEIAFLNGFNTYLNFYKAFKKRFGYVPSELSRVSEDTK